MKTKFFTFIGLTLGLMLAVSQNAYSSSKSVFITEVQTGSATSASEEFIEIYNSGSSDVDMAGWTLYYKSASGTTWTKKATVISGTLKSKSFWVFSANMPGDSVYSSGLSGTGGNIQIKDKAGLIIDQFGWGSANASLGSPAISSDAGQSMYRMYSFETLLFQNNDNNFADFDIADTPTPSKIPVIEIAEADTEPIIYANLELSELLPDPTSPLVDTNDEFIEIFNPTEEEVDLSGWTVRDESGSIYLIKDLAISPQSRMSIFSKDSKITLNNTGDVIQLIDPSGKIKDESADYGNAEPGLSWSKISGVWQWAVSATPDSSNADAYIEDISNPTKAVSKVGKTSKKPSAPKSSASKKSPSSKIANANNKSTIQDAGIVNSNSKSSNGWWPWLLGAAGIATIGYAVYEYRTEIQLFIRKLRRHP